MSDERLRYLAYRCYVCGRLLTRYEIYDRWDRGESDNLCPCGSNKISPTNPKLWEELFLPRVWRLWWFGVVIPWLRK